MEKVLVFRANMTFKPSVIEEARHKILEEIKDGVVIVPPWLSLVGVYDEVTVHGGPENVDGNGAVLRLVLESRGANGLT